MLTILRNEIEKIDNRIIELIALRLNIVNSVGRYKEIGGLEVKNENVEQVVLQRAKQQAILNNLSDEFIENIFKQIITESVSLQNDKVWTQIENIFLKPILSDYIKENKSKIQNFTGKVIAFQGELGAFSHLAILKNYPGSIPRPCHKFDDTFSALESDFIDFALVPLENSLGGTVNEVFNLLEENKIEVVDEVVFKVIHNLISVPNHREIRRVLSHPQGLAQCRSFIKAKGYEAIEFQDTAGAVKHIREHNLVDTAAIASEAASKLYEMKIIDKSIQDSDENYTRFLLLKKSKD